MVKALIFLLNFVFLSTIIQAEEFGTVKGRTAYKGEVIENVSILVYRDSENIDLKKPDSVSAKTAIDGTYEFNLKPGKYYLIALKKQGNNSNFIPETGDYYCFYSGAPVEVVSGGISYVGFNLIKVGKEGPIKRVKGDGGIYGEVFFEGKRLEKSYIYVYKDLKTGLRGPAYFVYPSKDGSFSINLPDGKYYIIARKRAKGGMYGPVEEGDYFNFYYGNPVEIKKGQMKSVNIECVKRLSQLEEGVGFSEISGYVKDKNGNPVAGLFVLFYQSKNMQGKPLYISARTDSKGRYSMKVPKGTYYLLARENIGGPPSSGEWYGQYKEAITVKDSEKLDLINVIIERVK
ncbi:MAG: carboxypeptidase-like regulatory domain-containing protein [Proteobacteria bacterium]|nr:carboxypeptidase-like regulatory domain-containing protein [Pseudomonadota bacterium]